jgi:hypothetical protein
MVEPLSPVQAGAEDSRELIERASTLWGMLRLSRATQADGAKYLSMAELVANCPRCGVTLYALEQGQLIGAKPPLRPKHVWSIRTKLQVDGRIRDLAMFNIAIH